MTRSCGTQRDAGDVMTGYENALIAGRHCFCVSCLVVLRLRNDTFDFTVRPHLNLHATTGFALSIHIFQGANTSSRRRTPWVSPIPSNMSTRSGTNIEAVSYWLPYLTMTAPRPVMAVKNSATTMPMMRGQFPGAGRSSCTERRREE